MPYKDKSGRIQTAIKLTDDQKIKLQKLTSIEFNGVQMHVSPTQIFNKIISDYLDALPDVVDSDADSVKAKPKTKKGTVNAK